MSFSFLFDSGADYASIRNSYARDYSKIMDIEEQVSYLLLDKIAYYYQEIEYNFNLASTLSDYWKRYAPRQRGRAYLNEAYPWGEVGEKLLEAYIYKIASEVFQDARFVGLPYGHDVRFVTNDAFIHLDIKSTGPHDNLDEVVASPNQVTGDGLYIDNDGVYNSPVLVKGPRRSFSFQPELPPFYVIDGKPRITLTYYLKCAYDVITMGQQPLRYLELICVPNGILMFDTARLVDTEYLLIPGKDTLDSVHKRTRIRLAPLSSIQRWRCIRVYNDKGEIKKGYRL